MLKKVLKVVARLEARAKKSDAAQLAAGTSLSKKLRNAIADLEGRAKEHDAAAIAARQAAQRLHEQLRMDAPVTPANKPAPSVIKPAPKAKPVKKIVPVKKTTAKPNAVTKAPAKTAAKSVGSPTLADAIQHVLKTRRDANAGGVKARQLYGAVQQAGYQFGSSNVENRMNYLHKTLRQHKARFKRAADGALSLA